MVLDQIAFHGAGLLEGSRRQLEGGIEILCHHDTAELVAVDLLEGVNGADARMGQRRGRPRS